MSRFRVAALAVLVIGLAVVAPAQGAAVTRTPGPNSYILADAELNRACDRFAVMRRPVRSDTADMSVATIQIYRTGNPTTESEPLCEIGPGRRIGPEPDPSWTPDGRTLVWAENGRGIFSTRVTSAPGCGLRPRLLVRRAHSPDLSRARTPRR